MTWIALIVAEAENGVIGDRGTIPWHLPGDLQHFRRLTLGHVVVAGRRTHESILIRQGSPLNGRITVVITSKHPPGLGDGPVLYREDPESALAAARAIETITAGPLGQVFVIGGAETYAALLPEVDRVYLTRVHADFTGDTRMPAGWLDRFTLVETTLNPVTVGGPPYSFERYEAHP